MGWLKKLFFSVVILKIDVIVVVVCGECVVDGMKRYRVDGINNFIYVCVIGFVMIFECIFLFVVFFIVYEFYCYVFFDVCGYEFIVSDICCDGARLKLYVRMFIY